MKIIQLSQNKVALVDDDDFEFISQHKWIFSKKFKDTGYAQRSQHVYISKNKYGCKAIYMHREIMKVTDGEVDHINGDKLDNRKQNLRIVSRTDNLRNQGLRSKNTSGHIGVYFNKQNNKWIAQITVDKKTLHLGCFETVEQAAEARKDFIIKHNLSGFRR